VGAFPDILQFVSTERDGQQRGNGQGESKIKPARFLKHVNTDREKNQKPDEFSGDVQFKTIAKTDPDEKDKYRLSGKAGSGFVPTRFSLPEISNQVFRYRRIPSGWPLIGAGLPCPGVSG